MIGLVLAAALIVQGPDLSPEATRVIAPVIEAIEREQVRQAALPPPVDVQEKFARMHALDQRSRVLLQTVDMSALPLEQRQSAMAAIWEAIGAVDAANQEMLLEMLPPEGWFYKSVYGESVANTAFLIVQHSDLDLWRRFVPVLEPLVATGEVDGQSYALMYDRLAINEGRPQRYGSQMVCRDGRWAVDTLEDPAHVDERRRAMGMVSTLAEYEAYFAKYPPCLGD